MGLDAQKTYLATSSSGLGRVFDVSAASAELVPGIDLPAAPIDLAVAPDGTMLLVGDVTKFANPNDYPGGLLALFGKPSALTSVVIDDPMDRYSPFMDVALAPNGTPHVWYISKIVNGSPFYEYGEATIEGGQAVKAPASVPGQTGWVHFGVGTDGKPVAFEGSYMPYQLRASVDGVVRPLGNPTSSSSLDYVVAALPWPAAAETVPYAVALLDNPGIRVVFPTGATGSQEIPLGNTPSLAPMCPSGAFPVPPSGCPGPCHESAVGVEATAFSAARLPGDVVVVAYVVKHDDYDVTFKETIYDTPVCASQIVDDHSQFELVVERVPLIGGQPSELLRTAIDPLDWQEFYSSERASIVDIHASGSAIAVALRLADAGGPKVRTLRLEP